MKTFRRQALAPQLLLASFCLVGLACGASFRSTGHDPVVLSQVRALMPTVAPFPTTTNPITPTESPRTPGTASDECVAWRSTLNCDPSGPRDMHKDKPCGEAVADGESGFCECAGYQQFATVTCHHQPFSCDIMCLRFSVITERLAVFHGESLTREEAIGILEASKSAADPVHRANEIADKASTEMAAKIAQLRSSGEVAVDHVHDLVMELGKVQEAQLDKQKLELNGELDKQKKLLAENSKPAWQQLAEAGRESESAGRAILDNLRTVIPFDTQNPPWL